MAGDGAARARPGARGARLMYEEWGFVRGLVVGAALASAFWWLLSVA